MITMKRIKAVRPLGHRVLVKPDTTEATTKGGIILPDQITRMEQTAQTAGTVLDIGEGCWLDTPSEAWCKVGDRVVFAKYAGMRFWDSVEGKFRDDLLLLNDLDITALITEEEEINV